MTVRRDADEAAESRLRDGIVALAEEASAAGDPDTAGVVLQAIRRLHDPAHPQCLWAVYLLSEAFDGRYRRSGSLPDLEQVVRMRRAVLGGARHSETALGGYLTGLGRALQDLYSATEDPQALAQAVDTYRRLVATTAPGHRHEARRLTDLTVTLLHQDSLCPEDGLLDEVIPLARRAAAATPADHPDRATPHANLGAALRTRWQRTGDVEDLRECAEEFGESLAATPVQDDTFHGRLNDATLALITWSTEGGRFHRVRRALDHFRSTIRRMPVDHPQRTTSVSGMGSLLYSAYRQEEDPDLLDAACESYREALRGMASDHARRVSTRSLLGLALVDRYGLTEDTDALEEGMRCQREILADPASSEGDRTTARSHLGVALDVRFKRDGRRDDLRESVALHRQALAATGISEATFAGRLSDLGVGLQQQYELEGDRAVIEEAVDLLRRSVAATPADDSHRLQRLSNLGAALYRDFDRGGRRAHLAEGIESLRGALQEAQGSGASSSHLAACCTNLGGMLCKWFESTRDVSAWEEGIAYLRRAVTLVPQTDPNRAHYLANLTNALAPPAR